MGDVINTVGIVAGILTSIIPLLKPSKTPSTDDVTAVTFAAGMSFPHCDPYKCANVAGAQPEVALWNDFGGRLSMYDNHNNFQLKDGQVFTAQITNTVPEDDSNGTNMQADYILLVQNPKDTNSICLAYVAVTQADANTYAWFGDVGFQCGQAWYYSDLITGSETNGQEADYKSRCMWLTAQPKPGWIENNGFSYHIPDFNPSSALMQEYRDHPKTLCDSKPRFMPAGDFTFDTRVPIYSPPLQPNLNGSDPDINRIIGAQGVLAVGKRSPDLKSKSSTLSGHGNSTIYGNRNSTIYGNGNGNGTSQVNQTYSSNLVPWRVVISDHHAHSALELCQHPNAKGPDFAAIHEGFFCDMHTRELWPICQNPKNATGCYDLKTHSMRGGGLPRRDGSGRLIPKKAYTEVSKWGNTGTYI